jgi:hypothetical protein
MFDDWSGPELTISAGHRPEKWLAVVFSGGRGKLPIMRMMVFGGESRPRRTDAPPFPRGLAAPVHHGECRLGPSGNGPHIPAVQVPAPGW